MSCCCPFLFPASPRHDLHTAGPPHVTRRCAHARNRDRVYRRVRPVLLARAYLGIAANASTDYPADTRVFRTDRQRRVKRCNHAAQQRDLPRFFNERRQKRHAQRENLHHFLRTYASSCILLCGSEVRTRSAHFGERACTWTGTQQGERQRC